MRIANGADDWRRAVREQFNNGADVIKIASHFSAEEVSAAVSEAHALGLRITCDCETFYVDRAVDAGVDMIEHPLPRSDEVIAKMAAKGVASDPTLVPYEISSISRAGTGAVHPAASRSPRRRTCRCFAGFAKRA